MNLDPPPAWQLPEGVDSSLWRYSHTPRLAVEEDEYFAGHPLFVRDATLVDDRLCPPGVVVDLGAGAGRHTIRLARRGFTVTAVDLSRSMLEVVAAKAERAGVAGRVSCVQANLCRLEALPTGIFDHALSLFSTLGMIRSQAARRRSLAEAFRLLRPGGGLALHAHNVWLNLGDPQGRRWLLGQIGKSVLGRDRFGDRQMTYRGVSGMEVHLYRWSELMGDLRSAGFRVEEAIPLDAVTAATIRVPWFLPRLRAGGWLIFARRP